MNINNISSLARLTPLSTEANTIPIDGTSSSGGGFGSLIKDAVESLDKTQKGAEQEIAKAVTGESPDLHKTIISLQAADLKFQLGLQVRNKLIGAYEEVMRMQV